MNRSFRRVSRFTLTGNIRPDGPRGPITWFRRLYRSAGSIGHQRGGDHLHMIRESDEMFQREAQGNGGRVYIRAGQADHDNFPSFQGHGADLNLSLWPIFDFLHISSPCCELRSVVRTFAIGHSGAIQTGAA